MKKSIVAGILGLAAAVPLTASAQGYILIGNGVPNYNPVMWQPPISQPVHSTDGVQLMLYFNEGMLTANQLTNGIPLPYDLGLESSGYYGYYGPTLVNLPGWSPGETYTFQVRASGNSIYGPVDTALSRSVLWYESANIVFSGGIPPLPPGVSQNSIGLTVYIPEPSTLALAGLSLGGLLFLRRKNHL